MKKKKAKKGKNIFIFVGLIVVIVVAVIGYLVVQDLKQEDILKKEIVNVSNKDFLTDNFEVEVKTNGDYAYIEEAIKTYYKELSDSIKVLYAYLMDDNLIQILSADNLESDGPEFVKSYQILKEAKDNSNASLETIIDLCKEETIKNLIDKEKVDNYYYELYLELMYTEDDLKEMAEVGQEMQTLSDDLNTFLGKVEAMLNMLETNSDSWYIEDEQLYFETNDLVTKYNELHQDLNDFAQEKFSSKTADIEDSDQSSI